MAEETIKVYVDGSYLNGAVGYGAVALKEAEVLREFSGPVVAEGAEAARNVTGELVAVGHALKWCQKQGFRRVELYFDYKGIEKWATGAWKAKQPLTQRYKAFMEQLQNAGLQVSFRKVKAHSGDYWNEYVDQLAKAGAAKAPAATTGKSESRQTAAKTAQAASGGASKLEEVGHLLEAWFQQEGLPFRFEGVKNQMFARLALYAFETQQGKPRGYFDLYHTRKKPWHPRLHGFQDSHQERLTAAAWEAFRNQYPERLS